MTRTWGPWGIGFVAFFSYSPFCPNLIKDRYLGITRTLVVNDTHGPWDDPRLTRLVLDIADDIKVDRIFLNGDILDFYNASQHEGGIKHPNIQKTLEDEMEWGQEFFSNLRKRFPNTEIIYNYGNHEDRLDRFIIKHAKVFWNLLTIEKQFRLDQLNIEYHRYNNRYQLEKSNFYIQHSPPSYASPNATFNKYPDCSSLYGCTHRVAMAARTGMHGKYYAYFNGWLSKWNLTPEHAEIFRFIKNHDSWQNSFCLVTVIDEVEPIINHYTVDNYKVVVDGNLYEG